MARAGGRQREGQLGEESDSFVRALARGLSVLALFDIEHPEWGLSDICARTGMSKTTAYRMVRTLETMEFVAYDRADRALPPGEGHDPRGLPDHVVRGLRPGRAPLLGATVGDHRRDRRADGGGARRGRRGGPSALDGIRSGSICPSVACRAHVDLRSFRMHLAFVPPAEQRKILAKAQPALTPNTMTDPEQLIERMAAERARRARLRPGRAGSSACVPSPRRCSSGTAVCGRC